MHSFESAMYPSINKLAARKDKETEEMLAFKSKKAAHNLFMAIWHAFCTIGLYYCVRGKPWTPWFLGGDGNFLDGFTNMPFTPMDLDGYFFGLIILGHPL
mmetsp:Transcript_9089/g.12362  ORF Transcript_9089/g.12362 Transcript_9089/m.12362 type:complete len:100 (-) Transcript_9089:629-928(-)